MDQSKKNLQSKEELDLLNQTQDKSIIDDFVKSKKNSTKISRQNSIVSNQSKMSSRKGGKAGVSNLIVKSLQDRMETVNKQIDEIYLKATENHTQIQTFIDDFYVFKRDSEKEKEIREEVLKKIKIVDRIINQIESDTGTSKNQFSEIQSNMTEVDKLTLKINDFVKHFEEENSRDNK